jgi:hypothetical protein
MKITIKLKRLGWVEDASIRKQLLQDVAVPEVEFDFEYDFENDNDFVICERIWANMNQYQGKVWDAMQPLPEPRPHTAMSIGDEVQIDGRAYVCAVFGFESISKGE